MKRKIALLMILVAVAVPAVVWGPAAWRAMQEPDCDPADAIVGAIGIGEPLASITLVDADEKTIEVDLASEGQVTVLWFWSTLCPCVGDCEERIRALLARYPEGVRFYAVDPHPQDTREDIEHQRKALESPYPVYQDPDGSTVLRLGIRSAASVAVFDADGVLRFRGAIDDDLDKPTVSYINGTIDALRAGRAVEPTEVEFYGCAYPD